MKTIKTSNLTGLTLDWAVAKCENDSGYDEIDLIRSPMLGDYLSNERGQDYFPSSNWSQAGPIIEREFISLTAEATHSFKQWSAEIWPDYSKPCTGTGTGPTPLIAAMRCYVASKLGDEIEVPEELCS